MTKRMIIMLVAVGVVFGGIFGFKMFMGIMMSKGMAAQGIPPQSVTTIVAGYEEWQPTLDAVGSLAAERGAELSAEVAGIVAAIHFRQGDDVKAGTLLLELDAASDMARLESAQAAAALAKTTYERDKAQFEVKAISRQTLDASEANMKQAQANVAEQRALVDKKRIRAPFAGRLGIRSADLGQYLQPGTPVVTLQSLDPIHADFFLPQRLLGMVKLGQAIVAVIDAYPDEAFAGKISVINPAVDPATRNVKVRATLANPEKKLLPGMHASVQIVAGAPEQRLTLPQTAISFNPFGNIVYLVESAGADDAGKPRLVAKQVFVTTGATRGDQIAVLSGIKEGDTVVTSGQLKLRNGSPVMVNNSIQPSNAANPQPGDG